jgi:O-antigen ligase
VIVLFAALFAGGNTLKYSAFYVTASLMAFAVLTITRGDAGKVGVLGAMVLLIPYWFSNRERLGRILVVLAAWCFVHVINQSYLAFLKRGPIINQPPFAADQAFLAEFTPFYTVPFLLLGLVLLSAGLCLILLLKKWPERPMKIAGFVFLGAVIIGSLLFVEIAGARRAHQPHNIIWQAREMLHGRLADDFGSARGWVWKNGFSVIRNNPWLGTGPDTFFFALGGGQTESVRVARASPRYILARGGLHHDSVAKVNMYFDKAHNTFLQIAVCMGLPALLAYLIFLGALFLPAIKKAFNRPILFAFSAGALSYLIQCFFQVDTPIDRPLLYIALGVMAVELWREKVEA